MFYDFSAACINHDHELFVLADNLPLVLFFYPRDNTAGCTAESLDFNNLQTEFSSAGFKVAGISRDNLASHQRFAAKYALSLPLLADVDEQICTRFAVIKPKMMYGKQLRGIERSTFVFAADGSVLREWRKVKVAGHAAEVLQYIKSL